MMKMSLRKYRNVLRVSVALVLVLLLLFHSPWWSSSTPKINPHEVQLTYPLAWKHIHHGRGEGGAWYIPPAWLKDTTPPKTILEAARFVSEIALNDPKLCLDETAIPSIIHQTWKSADLLGFPDKTLGGVEKWLEYAILGEHNMAYFLWDDIGARSLLRTIDSSPVPSNVDVVDVLPKKVEVADLFRVVVCNTIGGVYADIDTIPLRAPTSWVSKADITNWTDSLTGVTYGPYGSDNTTFSPPSHKPVSLILGIEADNTEYGDAYWRMGYTYPVQLTQWSLAGAPKQPVMNYFLKDLYTKVAKAVIEGGITNSSSSDLLKKYDPLALTGPVAITEAAREYLGEVTGLRWQSLSGIDDGGRSKVVLDTLILPITGFSPGRGKYGNMGSKPLTDPDARVQHYAQGSWRSFHLKVELGKACRTILGLCRDWSKVEES